MGPVREKPPSSENSLAKRSEVGILNIEGKSNHESYDVRDLHDEVKEPRVVRATG